MTYLDALKAEHERREAAKVAQFERLVQLVRLSKDLPPEDTPRTLQVMPARNMFDSLAEIGRTFAELVAAVEAKQ